MKKLTDTELTQKLNAARHQVEIGATYQHYKSSDMTYKVTDIVIQEEDNQPAVIYQAMYGERITFSRSVSIWLETIQVSGKSVPRFTKLRQ